MIISVNSTPNSDPNDACRPSLCSRPTRESIDGSSRVLTIGLLNNMPDAALEATERQFALLLNAASGDLPVRLLLFALPGVPRGASVAAHISRSYSGIEEMKGMAIDALIVTGREPLSPRLQDEPYWQSFTQVVDWARDHTLSTVWSCLAAHAAVLHMDGIERVRSQRKHCGVFDSIQVADHPLITNTGRKLTMPHSRWNGLDERDLARHGYRVLTRSALAGVDTFVREAGSLFVFFQGHPEYEANTLLLEYRRDVSRFLRGESTAYPNLPYNYFDSETARALAGLAREARLSPREELLPRIVALLDSTSVERSWNSSSISIYQRWLDYLYAQKGARASDGNHQAAAESNVARLIPPSSVFTSDFQTPRTAVTASRRISTVL